jgi:hypothetical protein
MVCGGYLGTGGWVHQKPNNQGEIIASYLYGICQPLGYAR